MTASWHLGRWESPNFAKNIEFVLLPVHRPTLFKHLELLCVGDAESHERQEHCTNADMRMCAFTNMPTMRTFKDRGPNVPLGSKSLEPRVQAIS